MGKAANVDWDWWLIDDVGLSREGNEKEKKVFAWQMSVELNALSQILIAELEDINIYLYSQEAVINKSC